MRHILLPLAVLSVSACDAKPAVQKVEDATIRLPAVPGNPGAAYFKLSGGAADDRLISVTSTQSIRAEMHDSVMEGGMMKMKPIQGGLTVPAGGMVVFKPGGKHVMLFDINPKIKKGDAVPLTLTFASGQKMETRAQAIGAGDAAGHDH